MVIHVYQIIDEKNTRVDVKCFSYLYSQIDPTIRKAFSLLFGNVALKHRCIEQLVTCSNS